MDRSDGPVAMSVEPCVLVVAASDSSGGAGLSRDVATIASFNLRSAVAVTAVTVQTHEAVRRVEPVEASLVADQMMAAFSANHVEAVKIGLVASAAAVAAVASILRRHPAVPVVVDPVLAASSGGALADRYVTETMVGELLPRTTLVTPNRDELAALVGRPLPEEEEAVLAQGRLLLEAGAQAVLAKGGHGTGTASIDHLIRSDRPALPFSAPRLDTAMRGTGCMLASAIAAGIARGETLEASVAAAKDHVHARLRGHTRSE